MQRDILFSFTVDTVTVEVEKLDFPRFMPPESLSLYEGAFRAFAEYVCYPFDVILRRVMSVRFCFHYDEKAMREIEELCEGYLMECSMKGFLEYLEKSEENAKELLPPHITEPDLSEERIEYACETIKAETKRWAVYMERLGEESGDLEWVRFSYVGREAREEFYGRYREKEGASRLLVSLPGYNAEWNDLSAYMDGDYDILAISPLGYNTPWGYDDSKRLNGAWPVLYETVCGIEKTTGYYKWVFQAALAVSTARKEGQELVFLGTSQGGGLSLILASVFNDETVACACEMPFFIGLSGVNYNTVRNFVADQMGKEHMVYNFWAKERLAVVDPMRHLGRLNCRILLVAGEKDEECKPRDIKMLYDALSCEKEYVELKGQGHGFTNEFKELAKAWISSEEE